ncbi:MAG: hypothetical protein AAFV25_17745, partial [Bacteroidota bacterium]
PSCLLWSQSSIDHSAQLSSSLSWSGADVHLAYGLQKGPHQLYAGPRLLLSNSHLPLKGPWGGALGYRIRLLQSRRLLSTASVEYKFILSEPYDPLQLGGDFLNSIHEWHLSYGLWYRLNDHWQLGSTIGTGFYLERLTDLQEQRKQGFSGYSGQLGFLVRYVF